MKTKRSQGSTSIFLLVIATLILCVACLFIFMFKSNQIDETISVEGINNVYNHARIIEFYLDQISAKIDDTENPSFQFKKELDKYRDSNGVLLDSGLIQVSNQLEKDASSHVYIDEFGVLIIKFDLSFADVLTSAKNPEKKEYLIKYVYSYENSIVLLELMD